MDKSSAEPESNLAQNGAATGSLGEFLNELYSLKPDRAEKSKVTDLVSPKEKYDAETEKKLDEMAASVADVIAKNGTFGGTFRERDYVVDSSMNGTFRSLGLYDSGMKELAARINKNLEKRGSDFRVDLDNSSDGLDHGGNWNGRHRNVDMYLMKKEDYDKRDRKFDFLDNPYKDKAIDRMQMHNVESREFRRDDDTYWRLLEGILDKGNFSGELSYRNSTVQKALHDALQHFGPDGVKALVKQLNQDLKAKGCAYQIDLSTREVITSKPGWGHSGMGVLHVDLKIVDGSNKPKDSLTLDQHFAWGAPILPGPPERIPPDRLPPGFPDERIDPGPGDLRPPKKRQ